MNVNRDFIPMVHDNTEKRMFVGVYLKSKQNAYYRMQSSGLKKGVFDKIQEQPIGNPRFVHSPFEREFSKSHEKFNWIQDNVQN